MAERDRTHERYDIPNADVLFEDVWANEEPADNSCPECGVTLNGAVANCPHCGARLDICSGSCSSCGARVCVEDGRPGGKG